MFIKRPSANESDEDLLRKQEEFLRRKEKSSVQVVRADKKKPASNSSSQDGKEPKSESDVVPSTSSSNKREESIKFNITDDDFDKYDTHITKALQHIVKERQVYSKPAQFPQKRHGNTAFPSSEKRSKSQFSAKKSIFAQEFARKNKDSVPSSARTDDVSSKLASVSLTESKPGNFPHHTAETGTENTLREVHKENLQKLQTMSPEEILKAQEEIRKSLGAKSVDFLKSKGRLPPPKRVPRSVTDEERFIGDLTSRLNADKEERKEVDTEISIEPDDIKSFVPDYDTEKWLNMDVVEKEKLQWMKELPSRKSTTKKRIDYPNRFDFNGQLLSIEESTEVDAYAGLHHHADQPDLAGYTLQELIDFTQSTVVQQRILSLKVIGEILVRDHSLEYLESGFITEHLLEAGLPFVLRCALDEKSDNVMKYCINAFHAMICSPSYEQNFSNMAYFAYRGLEKKSTSIIDKPNDSLKEKSDSDLVKDDLIFGVVRMDLIPRLRYILEVCHPDIPTSIKCLQIISNICQHSQHIAHQLFEVPRLVEHLVQRVVNHFTSKDFSCTLAHSLRVLNNLCSAGRHMLKRFLAKHKESVYNFILDAVQLQLQQVERTINDSNKMDSGSLQGSLIDDDAMNEIWKLAITIISYGPLPEFAFADSDHEQQSFVQLMLPKVGGFITVLNSENTAEISLSRLLLPIKFASCLLELLDKSSEKFILDFIQGCHLAVSAFIQNKLHCFDINNKDDLISATLCYDWIASYWEKLSSLHLISIDSLSSIENSFIPKVVIPFQNTVLEVAKLCCNQPEVSSKLQLTGLTRRYNDLTNNSADRLYQLIAENNFVSAFLHCSYQLVKIDLNNASVFIDFIIQWFNDVRFNLENACFEQSNIKSFSHMLYWSCKLCNAIISKHETVQNVLESYYNTITYLLTYLQPGDEFFCFDLLSSALFHQKVFDLLSSQSISTVSIDVPQLRHLYLTSLKAGKKSLLLSQAWCTRQVSEISSYLLPSGDYSLPVDWPFYPLLNLYNHAVEGVEMDGNVEITKYIAQILSFILFLEQGRIQLVQNTSASGKLARLFCVFLSGNDAFLEESIQSVLTKLIQIYYSKSALIDFKQPIPGIASFHDFYASLVEQYSAVSFGNDLFSNVILLPLIHDCDRKFKLVLWSDRRDAIRSIYLTEDDLFVDVGAFLHPAEKDMEVLEAYLSCLVCRICTKQKNPLMYRIATHHLSAFVEGFSENDNDKNRKTFMDSLKMLKIKSLHKDIFR